MKLQLASNDRISHFLIAIVNDNLLNGKKRVNEMALTCTCILSMVHSQWHRQHFTHTRAHTHTHQGEGERIVVCIKPN